MALGFAGEGSDKGMPPEQAIIEAGDAKTILQNETVRNVYLGDQFEL